VPRPCGRGRLAQFSLLQRFAVWWVALPWPILPVPAVLLALCWVVDEKGEAQVFCDRLFQAFGHGGYKAAGATLEYRVKGVAEGVPGTPGSSGDTMPNS
jgi:hypothetical protein